MIVYDFEVFKHDWLVVWLDTEKKKTYQIVNDSEKFKKFYEHYKNQVWIGYNSRGYDSYIAKAILCDFDPWEMNDWIINKGRKGFEFSKLLNRFPIYNYDTMFGFRSLKELEAYMGHDIRESNVPWDIDRKLTVEELQETIKYCKHDVMETFEVFMETIDEYTSHIMLMKEFDLTLYDINRTKAQMSANILNAFRQKYDDEFDIDFPDTLDLGKYEWVKDRYIEWARDIRNYDTIKSLENVTVGGIPHDYGFGGIHGAKKHYIGEGDFLFADVSSYYPAIMIEYGYLSRNVSNPERYTQIRDERLKMKQEGDPREYPRKIVLNSTFGASKDKYNNLYDPKMANNICIAGQLFLTDLIDKLDGHCELIQSNTDGILVKLYNKNDKQKIINICEEWGKRTRMKMDYDDVKRVIQKDVNNYIVQFSNGKLKRKGAFVKKLSNLDNDLPIVNKAVVDYFINGTPIETTVGSATKLINFQKITKITSLYEYAFKEQSDLPLHKYEVVGKNKTEVREYNGEILKEKVFRCFASLDPKDGTLYKKHKKKDGIDKTPGTPENCFINNRNIVDDEVPDKLDRQWYIDLAYYRVEKFMKD